jgi:hypothetical protein
MLPKTLHFFDVAIIYPQFQTGIGGKKRIFVRGCLKSPDLGSPAIEIAATVTKPAYAG